MEALFIVIRPRKRKYLGLKQKIGNLKEFSFTFCEQIIEEK